MDDISSGEIPLEPLPGEEIDEIPAPRASSPAKVASPPPPVLGIDDEDEEVAPPLPTSKAGYLPRIRSYEAAEEAAPDPEPKARKKSKPAARPESKPKATSRPIDRGTEAPRKLSEVRAKGAEPARARGKAGPRDDDPEKKGVLIEATPEQDTYEYRQRMRLFIGAGFVGVLLILGLFLWHAASGGPKVAEDDPSGEPPPPQPPVAQAVTPEKEEVEARLMYDDAHQFARRKDVKNATRLLSGIVAEYPRTPTAKLAQEALDRPKKNLPLFLDVPAVVAEESKAAPPPEPPKPTEVVAAPPAPPASPGAAVVDLVPPPTPPEPRRDTGLPIVDAKVPPKPLPEGFRARPEVGVHESGWPWEITCDKDGSALVFVPGGEVVLGSDTGPSNERPARKQAVAPYYIDQHEVTVGQYQLYLKDKGKRSPIDLGDGPADRPMTRLTAREAREFNQWAGKELPTEAQWEMAGRATDARIHPWGNVPAEWSRPRAPKQLDPVASFPGDLSPYGVFDLSGNAWEWTNEYFSIGPPAPGKAKAKQSLVTIKGGSKDWLLAWRDGVPVTSRLPHLGFRGVLSVEPVIAGPAAAAPGAPGNPGVIRPGSSPF